LKTDIKAWLEITGEPVAETAFIPNDAPPLPYIVYLDTVKRGGGDMKNMMQNHSLTVERYSETSEDNARLEALFEAQAIKYKKEKQWLSDEECFMTIYDFDLIEREV
jgi:hypothetical protein